MNVLIAVGCVDNFNGEFYNELGVFYNFYTKVR